jgi:hypothetical protein
MDDRSMDNTIEIARKTWSHQTVPLEIHTNGQNLGQWPNKANIISRIKAEYDWMLLLHSDDLVREDWVTSIVDSIKRYNNVPDLIFSECSNIDSKGVVHLKKHFKEKSAELNVHKGSAQEEVKLALKRGCYWKISGSAFKLSIFDEVGEFRNDYPYAGDYHWFLRFLSNGKKVAFLPKALLINRNHATSVAGLAHRTDKDIREFLAILNEYLEYVSYRFILLYHFRRYGYVLRRILRDITKGLFNPALNRLNTISYISKNFYFSISKKRKLD